MESLCVQVRIVSLDKGEAMTKRVHFTISQTRSPLSVRKSFQLTVGQLHALKVTVVRVQHLVVARRPFEVRAEAHPLLRHSVGGFLQGCGGRWRQLRSVRCVS